jgi:hypothetical protein
LAAVALLAASTSAHAQTTTAQPTGSQSADQVFKNIRVLKGLTVDDFMSTMGVMTAALSYCCSECHENAGSDLVKWEDDTPKKVAARRMVLMVNALNKNNFGGRQVVTCWTCHRGKDNPPVTASLDDDVYGTPRTETEDIIRTFPGLPSASDIFDKYLQAIGGTQRLSTLTSWVATGVNTGYDGLGGGGAMTVSAKAPDMLTTRIRYGAETKRPDNVRVYNGRTGWIVTPMTVLDSYELAGAELDGARFDALIAFPTQITQALTNPRVGEPVPLNGRLQNVVQGTGPRGLLVTLYFDRETGLLTRVLRYAGSPIGRNPRQMDYSDYRDVDGIKMPFTWMLSWANGRERMELKEVRLNVPIDNSVFGRPGAK